MPAQTEMVDQLKLHVRNRDFPALSGLLKEAERLAAQNPCQSDLLLDELEIHIEDLKCEAVRTFDREEFAGALEILEFLVKVKPTDRISRDYLEVCRQFCQPPSSDGAREAPENATGGAKVDRRAAVQAQASEPSELTRRMRTYFDLRDFDALKGVVREALRDGPASDRARRLEEEELKAEFEAHVRMLKNEAIQQFEGGDYCTCLGTFRFLCELEPGNPDLRRYLQTCLEFVQEQQVRDESRIGGSDSRLLGMGDQGRTAPGQSVITREQLSSPPDDILEIPAAYKPETSGANAVEGREAAKAWHSPRLAWLKLAVPAFGAVCLLIWLAIPRSSPQLRESRDAGSEDLSFDVLTPRPKKERTRGLKEGRLTQATDQQPEFDSYPVVHDHFIGSCKGTLRINSDVLSYVPSRGSKDGFTQPLSRIKMRLDDMLEIETNQNSYRFEVTRGKSARDRKAAARELYELLSRRQHES